AGAHAHLRPGAAAAPARRARQGARTHHRGRLVGEYPEGAGGRRGREAAGGIHRRRRRYLLSVGPAGDFPVAERRGRADARGAAPHAELRGGHGDGGGAGGGGGGAAPAEGGRRGGGAGDGRRGGEGRARRAPGCLRGPPERVLIS
ncbi:unnamed protein product, partial [Ectocarpus sp. 12 AP-2014]